jgi:hypothetical protein
MELEKRGDSMMTDQTNKQPAAGARQRNAASPARNVLRLRNFRLLWLGQGTSMLGDQFYLIALPWLVLRVSADPLVLGMVLALA